LGGEYVYDIYVSSLSNYTKSDISKHRFSVPFTWELVQRLVIKLDLVGWDDAMFSRTYGERDGDNIGGESGNDDFNM